MIQKINDEMFPLTFGEALEEDADMREVTKRGRDDDNENNDEESSANKKECV